MPGLPFRVRRNGPEYFCTRRPVDRLSSDDPRREQTLEDDVLMAELALGRTAALETLYQRHALAVYAYAFRVLEQAAEAEDVTQEVFVKVWEHGKDYQPRGRFRAWALRICLNLCRDRFRGRKTGEDLRQATMATGTEPPPTPEEEVLERELAEGARQAFGRLPLEDRHLLALRIDSGLSVPEVAEVTGCSVRTVQYRTSQALRRLRRLMGEKE